MDGQFEDAPDDLPVETLNAQPPNQNHVEDDDPSPRDENKLNAVKPDASDSNPPLKLHPPSHHYLNKSVPSSETSRVTTTKSDDEEEEPSICQEDENSVLEEDSSCDKGDGRTKAGTKTYESDICGNDVLCGRGGLTNHHPGNVFFRKLVRIKQEDYLQVNKRDKANVAFEIVEIVRGLSPPGRFLRRDSHIMGCWVEIGDRRAREKTSQALREGAPELREELTTPDDEGDTNGRRSSWGEAQSQRKRPRGLYPVADSRVTAMSMAVPVTATSSDVNSHIPINLGQHVQTVPGQQPVGVILQNHAMAPTLMPAQMVVGPYGAVNPASYPAMVGPGGLVSVPQNAVMMQQQSGFAQMSTQRQVLSEDEKALLGIRPLFHQITESPGHQTSADPYVSLASRVSQGNQFI